MSNHSELLSKLDLEFNNESLLVQALTHSSYANENHTENNERLEFLGDAVLELCMTKYIYANFSNITEGQMTKKRATLVCEEALVVYSNEIDLKSYILLGKGEDATGGRNRAAIIADGFEALLGAVFLDKGFDVVYELVNKIVVPYLDKVVVLDNKSFLQELVQADKRSISYEIVKESGPSHDKTFESVVKLEGNIILGYGVGKTKKDAEQAAASEALKKIAK